jgi:signal transduction histidine kinase/CheY-like chemotaxis protein
MDDLTLLVMAMFAVVFAGAAWSAFRTRQVLARDLTLVFSGLTLAFVLELDRRVLGMTVPALQLASAILILGQPVFTMRVVGAIRALPRWLVPGSAVALVVATIASVVLRGPLGASSFLILIVVFGLVEGWAALYFVAEARRRRGAARARLALAAVATGAFAIAIALVTGTGFGPDSGVTAAALLGIRAMLLLAAVTYLVALLPPGPIRRIWQAMAAFRYAEALIDAPPTESAQALWARLAEAATTVTGDPCYVVVAGDDGTSAIVAEAGVRYAGAKTRASRPFPAGALETLRSTPGRQPALDPDRIRTDIAARSGARHTEVVPIAASAAIVIAADRASLFGEDDRALLEVLGVETSLVVERRRMLGEQQALAERLARTVGALQAASAAKSDFLASMSHELRTPLNAIIGFSELMRTEAAQDEQVTIPVEWVEHVNRSGQHLLGLINDVLDLAKVEAGRLELTREPVDVAAVAAESLAGLRPLADQKGITLSAHLAPAIADADKGRLRQILYNLLSNAIKFTPDDGRVTVEVRTEDGNVLLTVADTGVGIAAEDHDTVFEEFRQVGDPAAHQAGTGLGLALTRRLVEAHGGTIALESRLGAGSRFTVTLAAAMAPAVALSRTRGTAGIAPRDMPVGPAASGSGVLIIEDDPSAVRLLREYLEADGHTVRASADGSLGIEEARRERPAAIVLDVLLPGIDGWEVLRRLKADDSLREIPVVIVTVVDEREVGLALGAVDYFLKPVDREALLTRLGHYTFTTKVKTRQVRVLVVDDDPASLKLVDRTLSAEGFTVRTVGSGRAAIDLARREAFDLVICDLVMPEVDGFEVVASLKKDPRATTTPILILTAHELTAADKARLGDHILGIVAKGPEAAAGLRDWLRTAIPPKTRSKSSAA